MSFKGPDSDLTWWILIFVFISISIILIKYCTLKKRQAYDHNAAADLKASKIFLLISITFFTCIGVFVFDYNASRAIQKLVKSTTAEQMEKTADAKRNVLKKVWDRIKKLESEAKTLEGAEAAEKAREAELLRSATEKIKSNVKLTDEEMAAAERYYLKLHPGEKPIFSIKPPDTIKTFQEAMQYNRRVSNTTTEIVPQLAEMIEKGEISLRPGLSYIPAKDGKAPMLRWDNRTRDTGIIYNGEKYTTNGKRKGAATPEELQKATKFTSGAEEGRSAPGANPESGTFSPINGVPGARNTPKKAHLISFAII